jgi:hypothetical protein
MLVLNILETYAQQCIEDVIYGAWPNGKALK